MQIRLNRMRSHGYGLAKGPHGVLREGGLVAAVGDGLGEFTTGFVIVIAIGSVTVAGW